MRPLTIDGSSSEEDEQRIDDMINRYRGDGGTKRTTVSGPRDIGALATAGNKLSMLVTQRSEPAGIGQSSKAVGDVGGRISDRSHRHQFETKLAAFNNIRRTVDAKLSDAIIGERYRCQLDALFAVSLPITNNENESQLGITTQIPGSG